MTEENNQSLEVIETVQNDPETKPTTISIERKLVKRLIQLKDVGDTYSDIIRMLLDEHEKKGE